MFFVFDAATVLGTHPAASSLRCLESDVAMDRRGGGWPLDGYVRAGPQRVQLRPRPGPCEL